MKQLKPLLQRRYWWLWLLFAAELVFLFGRLALDWRAGTADTIGPDRIIPYAEQALNDERGAHVENFTGQFATTRWIDLEPGSYQVVVHYVNDGEPGRVQFLDEIMPTAQYDDTVLPPGYTSASFTLWMEHGCETAQLQFYADCGEGEAIFITGVEIVPTHSFAYVHFLTALVFFLLADWAVLLAVRVLPFPVKSLRGRYSAVAVAGIVLLACLPLALGYLTFGHDLSAHLSRIEGLKAGLLSGQFPVRVNPDLLEGRGYAFSLMYADLLLYPAAVLRILGFPLYSVYQLYVAAITLATALVTRYVLRRMLGSEGLALLGTALYTLSFYRLTCVYVRASVGEYSAMLFLPVVVYGLWRIYTEPAPAEKKRGGIPAWAALAVGFSGLLQTHLLTTLMAGLFSLVFCLAMAKRTFRKPVLPRLFQAAGAAVVWNLWFLVPLAQFMIQGVCRISGRYDATYLYDSVAWIGQIFTMFGGGPMDTVSGIGYANSRTAGMTQEMPLSVGTVLAAGALLFLLAMLDPTVRRADRRARVIGVWSLGFGAAAIWLASDLCPWYSLYRAENPVAQALSRLLGKLQYVWRFLTPATLLLVFATVCAIALFRSVRPELARQAAAAALLLTVIPAGYLLFETCYNSPKVTYMSLASLHTHEDQVAGGEYMPYDVLDAVTEVNYAGTEVEAPEGVALESLSRGALQVSFTAANTTDETAAVRLPLYAYPGYSLTDTAGGAKLGRYEGYLTVELPAGYSGSITVRFSGCWFWRIGDVVSLAGILATAVWWRRRRPAAKAV